MGNQLTTDGAVFSKRSALSIMGQNTNSLVGVAISASLLPPCVNTGLLFAEATLRDYYFDPTCLSNGNNISTWSDCCLDRLATERCPTNTEFPNFCCTNIYYSPAAYESMGGISLALTIVNITCIWIFGSLTFLLKEVAPLPNKVRNTFFSSPTTTNGCNSFFNHTERAVDLTYP